MAVSSPYLRARKRAEKYDKNLEATDFKHDAIVIGEDGSQFFVRSAMIRRWTDPDKTKWIFLIGEHHELMVFDETDVTFYAELVRVESEEIT